MLSTIIQFFFVSFITMVVANAKGIANTSTSSLATTSVVAYPPRGLLDSIHSMKVREELYQRELKELAARQLMADPGFPLPEMSPMPSGILESIRSIEGFYSSLLLAELFDSISNGVERSPIPTSSIPPIAISSTIPPTIRPGLPSPPPQMTNYATPQTSNAPQPHVFISIVWVLVISFIIGMTLYTALNSFGTFILIFLILNVICAVIVGVDAHQEPRRRLIGGLRPGPIGKIPCGPVRGRIGTKQGHGFVHGVDRKVGRLRPVMEELMCDDWSNAESLFGRGMAIPTPTAGEVGDTTTIYTTRETTVWVTVEDTATQTCENTSSSASSTPFGTPASTLTAIPEPTPPLIRLSDLAKIDPKSSAVPSAVNIRTSAFYLFLLYLLGIFVCFLSGGTPGVLSYVVISFTIIAIVGGAEAFAIPDPAGLQYSVGRRVAVLRSTGAAKVRDARGMTVWNVTHAVTGSVEGARLREICGEVYCHNWPSTEHETPTLTTSRPSPTYMELAKRLSTEYVTVTPTSGIIGIFGPQIIPVTVESTAYENVIVSTVDVERVRSTRTKFVTVEASKPTASGPILTVSKTGSMGGFDMTTLTAMPSDEVRVTISASPASEMSIEKEVEASTVFVTTTESPLPASTVFLTTTITASPSSSSSSSLASTSSSPSNKILDETSAPTTLPVTSSASHLGPRQLYLSFVEKNLYCFLFLFMGLQIALTMSHPLVFLGSMRC